MVGTGILSNNMRSRECYTTFWMMAIYIDTLHWSGITPIFGHITDLNLITEFDLLPNCERFPWNICNGCGMPTEDAYSSGPVVLSHFGTCKRCNVETNTSWTCLVSGLSNIHRYFCFCLMKKKPNLCTCTWLKHFETFFKKRWVGPKFNPLWKKKNFFKVHWGNCLGSRIQDRFLTNLKK